MFDLLFRKLNVRNARRYKRFRADFLVRYQINGRGGVRITNARDIGAGGIRFWTDERVPESSLVNISVYLPPLERSVEATAQVLRTRKVKKGLLYYVAVKFLELSGQDREAINEFAESLSQDEGASLLIDHADIVVRKRS